MNCRFFTPRAVSLTASLFLCSCATVDHSPELLQAQQRVTAATGHSPAWTADPSLREFSVPPGGELSVQTAMELALANNRALRAEFELLAQAKAQLVQAGLLPNPMFSMMLGLPEAGGLANLTFGLSQDLAALWLIPARQRLARATVQQRILALADSAVVLLTDVRIAYADAQFQRLAAAFQEENLAVLADARAVTESRLRVGGAQLDLTLIRARHAEAQIELLQLRTDYRLSQRTLLRLMGVAEHDDDWVTPPLNPDQPAPKLSVDEAQLVELALLQRLDAQAAWWELESAVADIENQRRSLLPSLQVGVSGERFDRRALPDRDLLADTARASIAAGRLTPPMIESAGQRRKERSQMIELMIGPMVQLPVPIFDQNRAQIALARARAKELRERYEETQQRIAESVRRAAANRRLAEERLALYRESLLPLQRSNLELALAAYRTGRESILAVLLAQESLIGTQLGYARALRDLEIAAADLERQLSGPIPTSLLRGPATAPASAPASPQTQPATPQEQQP